MSAMRSDRTLCGRLTDLRAIFSVCTAMQPELLGVVVGSGVRGGEQTRFVIPEPRGSFSGFHNHSLNRPSSNFSKQTPQVKKPPNLSTPAHSSSSKNTHLLATPKILPITFIKSVHPHTPTRMSLPSLPTNRHHQIGAPKWTQQTGSTVFASSAFSVRRN